MQFLVLAVSVRILVQAAAIRASFDGLTPLSPVQQHGQIREEDVREVQPDSDATRQEARRLLWQVLFCSP